MTRNNDGKYIGYISAQTICEKHSANQHVPCWATEGGSPNNFVIGICGSRIRKAGFNGTIDPRSLRQKSSGGRNGKPAARS